MVVNKSKLIYFLSPYIPYYMVDLFLSSLGLIY